jgi:hypothetical protein
VNDRALESQEWDILCADLSEMMSTVMSIKNEEKPTMIMSKLPEESNFNRKMADVHKEAKDHVSGRDIDRQLKEQFNSDADKKIDEYTNGKKSESPLTSKHWNNP